MCVFKIDCHDSMDDYCYSFSTRFAKKENFLHIADMKMNLTRFKCQKRSKNFMSHDDEFNWNSNHTLTLMTRNIFIFKLLPCVDNKFSKFLGYLSMFYQYPKLTIVKISSKINVSIFKKRGKLFSTRGILVVVDQKLFRYRFLLSPWVLVWCNYELLAI